MFIILDKWMYGDLKIQTIWILFFDALFFCFDFSFAILDISETSFKTSFKWSFWNIQNGDAAEEALRAKYILQASCNIYQNIFNLTQKMYII